MPDSKSDLYAQKDLFFKKLFFRYTKFLSCANATPYMKEVIDYAKIRLDPQTDYKRIKNLDKLKNARLKIGTNNSNSIQITEEQLIASVDEFFDILSSEDHKSELGHVEKMMNYTGTEQSFKDIIVEDKIFRSILQWFWSHMNDYGKNVFERTGCDKEGKCIGKVEEQIFQKNGNTDAARITTIISCMLDKEYGKEYYHIAEFLQIRNHMRNYDAHELEKKLSLEERVDAVQKILLMYVATVLGLRDNLVSQRFLLEEYAICPISTCELTVYNGRKDKVELIDEKGDVIKGNELSSRIVKYCLQRTNNYKIQTSNISKDIKRLYQCYSHPVAICKNESITLYVSEREISPEQDDLKDRILAEVLNDNTISSKQNTEAIDKNTQAIIHLTKTIETGIGENNDSSENLKGYKIEGLWIIILTIVVIAMLVGLGILLYPDNQKELSLAESKKSTNAMISIGDSLLNIVWDKDYRLSEQVGQTYREAIGQLRSLAEQHNSSASIDLCHLYISGKGCFNLDSAFYYAQKNEVRETKEGQGLYAYLLLKRGEMEQARKEFLRAIDPEEPYICLTKALYDIQNSINNQTTMQASKQTCESAYQRLSSINNDDAIFEKAIIDLWGIRDGEDEFLIHPNFGKAFNALYGLASRNPFAILILGDIYNLMGDVGTGLTYHGTAFYCGIQEKAAIAINSSLILNPDGFSLTDKGWELKEIVAGKTNVIGGIGGILSDYVHYIDREAFDLAIKEADSLFYISQQKTGDVSFSDTSFISKIRITSRLKSGKSDDFSEAVHLAMQRDNCTDSIAVANYLKGVCLAKGYGCQKDINKSDELILSSAERGTYTEALHTIIKRFPPVFYPDGTAKYWLPAYRDLSYKSPKLACAVMDAIINDSIAKNIFEKDIPALASWLPKEVRLMSDLIGKGEEYLNNESVSRYKITELPFKIVEGINDYICYTMNNGNFQMAKIGCTFYVATVNSFILSSNLNSYEKSILSSNLSSYEGFKINLNYGNNTLPNKIPSFPDYAY